MKNTNKIRLLILGAIFVITIIIVIVILNINKTNVDQSANNIETNYTESSDGTKVNTSENVSGVKEVGDVKLEQSKIVYNMGTSKLTSKVTNNAIPKDNLRFKVKFIANDGSVIAESVGFVGKIKANEIKYIDSYITLDTSNSKDVTYELIP